MPQREPLSAPLLGALVIVGALAAGWLDLGVEGFAQAGVAALEGARGVHVMLEPPFGLPVLVAGESAVRSAWEWAAYLLAGPVAAMAVGAIAHGVSERLRSPAWVRVVALQMFAFAWLRLPILVLAAGIERGTGPLASAYGRLGDPESGRWAAIALGALLLWVAAGIVAGRAVSSGREWLRVDGVEFRRRLVRLLAAYPFAAATAAYALARPVLPAGWLAALLLAAGVCLVVETP